VKVYHCDICGKKFDPNRVGASLSDRPRGVPGVFGVACSGIDVCPNCMRVGETIDFKEELLNVWEYAVQNAGEGNV